MVDLTIRTQILADCVGWYPNSTSLASNRNAYKGTYSKIVLFDAPSAALDCKQAGPRLMLDYLIFVRLNLDQDQAHSSLASKPNLTFAHISSG